MKTRFNSESGFTLVELLIVVIILGILAAIAIPSFSTATSESKESVIAANLATMRQAIELYQLNHNGSYPGTTVVTQLTTQTDKNGAADTTYGPYLRTKVPDNPVNDNADVKTATTMPGSPSGPEGWVYATSTGEIRANLPGTAPSGTAYFDL